MKTTKEKALIVLGAIIAAVYPFAAAAAIIKPDLHKAIQVVAMNAVVLLDKYFI